MLLALGRLQITLQRSRLAIVGLVATATAKTCLLLVAAPLYGGARPDECGAAALTVLAVAARPATRATRCRRRAIGVPALADAGRAVIGRAARRCGRHGTCGGGD